MDKTPKLDVRVFPLTDPDNSTKAFASVGIDDGSKGLFVTMPQSKDQDGNYHDIAFPLNKELRQEISKAILDEFKSLTQTAEKSVDKVKDAPSTGAKPKTPDDLAI